MTAFNWDDFETVQEPAQNEGFDWDQFETVEPETSYADYAKEGLRHVARTGARIGETLVGLPGDIVNFVQDASQLVSDSILGESPELTEIRKQSPVKKYMPTSENLRKVTKNVSGGYTEPKNETEEFFDDVTSLATNLAIPMKNPGGFIPLLKSVGNKVLTATATKGAGRAARELGAGPLGEALTEAGTLFTISMWNQPSVKQFIKNKYEKAYSSLPEGTIVQTEGLKNKVSSLREDLSKGISTPSKKEALNALNDVESKIASGKLSAEEMTEIYKNLNERMSSKNLFENLNSTERKNLSKSFNELKDGIRDNLQQLEKSHPDFYKNWIEGNEAYAVNERSKYVSNWISSQLKGPLKHLVGGGIASVLFTGHAALPASAMLAKTAGASAVVGSGIKAGELMYRISKSSTLRQHYQNVLNAALKEDSSAFLRNYNKLNSELEKNIKENKIDFEKLYE